jgi:hypothetical protein
VTTAAGNPSLCCTLQALGITVDEPLTTCRNSDQGNRISVFLVAFTYVNSSRSLPNGFPKRKQAGFQEELEAWYYQQFVLQRERFRSRASRILKCSDPRSVETCHMRWLMSARLTRDMGLILGMKTTNLDLTAGKHLIDSVSRL